MKKAETKIQPIRPTYFKDPQNKDHGRSRNSFQQVLTEKVFKKKAKLLNRARGEFTGFLNSYNISIDNRQNKYFRLEMYNSDLLLKTSGQLMSIAKQHLWHEVRVRGSFDESGTILNVERIIPVHVCDELPLYIQDSDWEVERFRNCILKDQSIEPSIEHLVS